MENCQESKILMSMAAHDYVISQIDRKPYKIDLDLLFGSPTIYLSRRDTDNSKGVYILRNPETWVVEYLGKTGHGLKNRLNSHHLWRRKKHNEFVVYFYPIDADDMRLALERVGIMCLVPRLCKTKYKPIVPAHTIKLIEARLDFLVKSNLTSVEGLTNDALPINYGVSSPLG